MTVPDDSGQLDPMINRLNEQMWGRGWPYLLCNHIAFGNRTQKWGNNFHNRLVNES